MDTRRKTNERQIMRSALVKSHQLARHKRANFATYRDALAHYMRYFVPLGNAAVIEDLRVAREFESFVDELRANNARRRGELV